MLVTKDGDEMLWYVVRLKAVDYPIGGTAGAYDAVNMD